MTSGLGRNTLPDFVVETPHEVVLLFDVEFIAGYLVVNDVGFHLGGQGRRQLAVLSHLLCLRYVFVEKFLAFAHLGEDASDFVDDVSHVDKSCVIVLLPMIWTQSTIMISGRFTGVISPYPTVRAVVQAKYRE